MSDTLNLTNQTIKAQQALRNSKILFICSFTLLLFAFEYIFRSNASDISNRIMKQVIKRGDTSHCHILEKFQFFESNGRFLLLFFLLNFTNTFGALSFVILDSVSVFLNGCLKMVYMEPRPYWVDQELFPCLCAANYGNPSTTGMNQFLIFAVAYKAVTSVYKQFNRAYVAAICAVPVVLIYSSRYFQGAHSLNQLAFGGGIGFVLYYVYFEILEVDIEDPKSFKNIFNYMFHIASVLIALFLIVTAVHLNVELENNQDWLNIITSYCEVNNYNVFDNESFRKTSKVFLIVGCFVGVKLEAVCFESFEKFAEYSLDSVNRFSNTSVDLSLIRVVIMYVLFLLGGEWVYSTWVDIKTDTFFNLTVYGYILPYLINGVLIFFVYKYFLLRWLGLTNEKVHCVKQKDLEVGTTDVDSETESVKRIKKEIALRKKLASEYLVENHEVEVRFTPNYNEKLLK